MNKVLEVKDLSFAYEEETVLEGVFLDISEGEFVGIIGDNGVGKSTLLKLLLGNMKASSGTICFHLNSKTDVAYIAQDAIRLTKDFPTTVEELLGVHLRYLKRGKSTEEYLETVHLAAQRKKRLNELSGGQLQRVALMLALAKEAKIIFLDEPLSGIDRKFAGEFLDILRETTKQGRAIVMVTHQLAEAEKYFDKIYRVHEKHCLLAGGKAC